MFKVEAVGRPGWFSKAVRLVALEDMSVQSLGRQFEGYQQYSVQTYQADFKKGDVIVIGVRKRAWMEVGDLHSAEALMAQGHLRPYTRLVATRY